jgi:hypothetical protein
VSKTPPCQRPTEHLFITFFFKSMTRARLFSGGIAVADGERKRRKKDMETKQKVRMFLCAMLASFSIVATSQPAMSQLTCGGGQTISAALRTLRPGDTLFVSGTCNENVVIPE